MIGKVVLYSEAGSGVGLGHLFRLAPLFARLQGLGTACHMLAPLAVSRLRALGLHNAEETPTDSEGLCDSVRSLAPSCLVIDSYVRAEALIRLAGEMDGCRVMVFDDHYLLRQRVDAVINPSPGVEPNRYRDVAAQVLHGPDVYPMPLTFCHANASHRVHDRVRNIMVSLGGDDASGNLTSLLERLVPLLHGDESVYVVGANMPSLDMPGVNCLGWLDQDALARLAFDCDVAVTAGGCALHQFACVGLPALCWPQNENQRNHAASWGRVGSVVVADGLEALPDLLHDLYDPKLRDRMSTAGKNAVTGRGVDILTRWILDGE